MSYNAGNYNQAILNFTNVIQYNSNNKMAYYYRAQAYFGKKNYNQAISDNTQVIRLDPGYVWAYNNRAAAYYNIKEYIRAIADLSEAIRLNPNSAFAYNLRGKAYYYKDGHYYGNPATYSYTGNNWYSLVKDLEKTVEIEPSNTEYRNDLIRIRRY
jgi:tetratricopeptide (TPR) repeat protein